MLRIFGSPLRPGPRRRARIARRLSGQSFFAPGRRSGSLFAPRNRRRRTGRLTRFGRVSLALGLLSVAGLAWLVGRGDGFAFRWGGASAPGALPAVSAPPPRADSIAIEGPEVFDPPVSRERFAAARVRAAAVDPAARPRLVEWRDATGALRPVTSAAPPVASADLAVAGLPTPATSPPPPPPPDGYRVEYSLDEALSERVFEILRRGRVARGQALVVDPRTGRLLAYAVTDRDAFPPEGVYPAASIVKVLVASALLDAAANGEDTRCVYRGNKYRLHWRRLDRPKTGRESDLEQALATSNNQCFSQWALHVLGEERLRETIERFGWLAPPVPGHPAGRLEPVESRLDLGRLGSGLDGLEVTPLHVASLTSVLFDGRWRAPWWVDRVVDAREREVPLPPLAPAREVTSADHAARLRELLVATTTRGTAKSAFRDRRGRPRLGPIRTAGKTGNLTGGEPFGRYEWFVGVAPAEDPTIGVVVVQLQDNLWWKKSSQLAASILAEIFCEDGACRAERARQFTGDLGEDVAPLRISTLDRPFRVSRLADATRAATEAVDPTNP